MKVLSLRLAILSSWALSAYAIPKLDVNLGTADPFAVLAGSTVTNTGATTVHGNLGVWPGTAITDFPPGIVSGGTIHANDAVAMQAQSDLTTAYNFAAGQPCGTVLTGQDLGGLTLTSGVYCFASSAQLTGTLTLDAQGDPNAVFLFQIGSTLTTASRSSVVFINGGQGDSVFWQVGELGDAWHHHCVHRKYSGARKHHAQYRRNYSVRTSLGAQRRRHDGYECRVH